MDFFNGLVTWKISLSTLLGAFFAYTLVKLIGWDPYVFWPYITGLIIGFICGVLWELRSSD